MQPLCASVSHLWNGENNSEIAQQVRTALTPTTVKCCLIIRIRDQTLGERIRRGNLEHLSASSSRVLFGVARWLWLNCFGSFGPEVLSDSRGFWGCWQGQRGEPLRAGSGPQAPRAGAGDTGRMTRLQIGLCHLLAFHFPSGPQFL